jgi:hypothetical protein
LAVDDEISGAVGLAVPCGETQRAERWIAEKPAFVVARECRIQLPCMIIDMSAVGACIGIPSEGDEEYVDPMTLPDVLILDMRCESTEVECQVVWRSGSRIGLSFLSSPQPY